MNKRSTDPEIMDLGPDHYTKEEYDDCLYQLGRIGKYLGTDKAMLKIFSNLKFESVLDVGCGGGSFTTQLAKKFKHSTVVGIDISEQAIDYAKKENPQTENLKFELRIDPKLREPEKSFDIVTCTLVCHHLSDEDLVDFLKRASFVAKKHIIISDLHRHWLAYAGCYIIMPLFFRNRLNCHDGLLSIKKSFIKKELESYLNKAGFNKNNYKITWHWPFRWIVRINLI